MEFEIRRLGPDDADALVAARRRALESAPLVFRSSPGDDRLEDPAFRSAMLSDERQAVFGAFVGGSLVGLVGIVPESRPKTSHRSDIWGLFVDVDRRRSGIGRALVEHAVRFARALEGVSDVDLSVTDAAPEAAALYRSLGFEEWGRRPGAIIADGVAVGERFMRLRL